MRIGAIDVGSYSVRITVADVDGGIEIVKELGYITSLADGLRDSGFLKMERVEETLRVLERYREEVNRLGCDRVIAVATEALRRAKNAGEFIELVRKKTGFELEIITPEEEGKLAFLAVAYSLRPEGRFLVVDQGGGSTELVYGEGLKPERIISLPIGIVNLTERFIKSDPPSEKELAGLMEFVRSEVRFTADDISEIIGLGGTITTLVALEKGIYPYDPSKVHGERLSLKSLERWLKVLASIPYAERSRKYRQVEDRRAKVIVSGIAMYVEILKVFGKESLRVSDWGVKHGLIVRTLLEDSV